MDWQRSSQWSAALRDFKPANVRVGSTSDLTLGALMSASARCGHKAAKAYDRVVPILLQKSQIARL